MNLKNNKLLSSILVISSATAFAQFLNILFSPIVTRIYSPEEFGVVAIFTVLIGVLGISTLKFEVAIPIAKTDRQATILIFCSMIISLSFNVLLFILLIIFNKQVYSLIGFQNHQYIIYLIPLGSLLISLFTISREWAIRKSNYKNISKAIVTQSLSGNISKVIFGLVGFSALGLAISRIITGSLGVISLSKTIFKNLLMLLRNISIKELTETLIRYKSFAIYMTPNTLILILIAQFPILVIGLLYEPATVGYYSLAHTIIMLPIAVLGDSIADVFYSESAKVVKIEPEKIMKLSKKMLVKLFIISVIPALVLITFGPLLFKVIFGAEWYYAGVYSQILSLVLVAKMTFHPMNKIFELIEKQKHKLYINIIQIILLIVLLYVSMQFNITSLYFIIFYSLIVFIMNLITFIYSYTLLKKYIIHFNTL